MFSPKKQNTFQLNIRQNNTTIHRQYIIHKTQSIVINEIKDPLHQQYPHDLFLSLFH